MKKDTLFITLTHGDELIGLKVIKKLQKINNDKFDYIVANPKAHSRNRRFIDSDLNRIFPGKKDGDYEQRRAFVITQKGKKYKQVIDLHGTVSKTGIFIIITKLTKENLSLALKLNIKRIVIWTDVSEVKGSLSTFMPCGVEIESGPKKDKQVQKDLLNILSKFLSNKKEINLKTQLKKKDIFVVFGKLDKESVKPKVLKDWKGVGNYYPLFVDQYKDVHCYKLKKASQSSLLELLK